MSVSADNHDRTTKKSSALRCLALVALVEFWEAQKGGHLGALHGSRMVSREILSARCITRRHQQLHPHGPSAGDGYLGPRPRQSDLAGRRPPRRSGNLAGIPGGRRRLRSLGRPSCPRRIRPRPGEAAAVGQNQSNTSSSSSSSSSATSSVSEWQSTRAVSSTHRPATGRIDHHPVRRHKPLPSHPSPAVPMPPGLPGV